MKKSSPFADGWRHCAPPQNDPDRNPSASWSISDRGVSIIANLGNIINEKNQSSELWQAQRQADRENTNAMQDAGVLQITSDPETYLRYLNCQADNPSYSAGNVALVMVQDQKATIFGTKERWKSLNRGVSPAEEKNLSLKHISEPTRP